MTNRRYVTSLSTLFLRVAALLAAAQVIYGQSSILGTNLIVNGSAEAGPASPDGTVVVASIPGWTRMTGTTGNANVLPYGLTGFVLLSDPAPPDHGFQYFATKGGPATLTQVIDVSSGSSTISGGNVKYTVSGYLGSTRCCATSQMTVAFQNANGQTFSTVTLSPDIFSLTGMLLQQQIGLVPSGTIRIAVTLTLNNQFSAADSLSLVLSALGTNPGAVLGTNLVSNGGAEAGASAPPQSVTAYVPGWSTAGATVCPYGGTGWVQISDPGPADRGTNLFCGQSGGASGMYQDIDVSPAASLIDAAKVTYGVSAWLGGVGGQGPTLTYLFFDWSGKQLAATAQLGPSSGDLTETAHSGTVPSGTRRVNIAVSFPNFNAIADDIAFTLATPTAQPVITPGGIVSASAFGGFNSISPGSWIEIYGLYLAPSAMNWSSFNSAGLAPTSLGGVSVSVGGQSAFLDYVSPGQVNALVPSSTPAGAQPVTVTNANGTSDQFWLIVNPTEPGLLSLTANNKQYVAALFSDGATYALPANAITGVPSRPAMPGETVILYGVGFGPVTGGFNAGTMVTQQNSLTTPIQFLFGTTAAALSYYGLAPGFTGLYQFNVVVPTVPVNAAEPISFTLGGRKGSQTLYIAVQ